MSDERSSTPADVASLADRVVTLLMTETLGPELDLREVEGASELSASLQRHFEAPYAPLLDAAEDKDPSLVAALRMLVAQTAASRADLFLIKSALSGDNRYVTGRAAGTYEDPLIAARRLMDASPGTRPHYPAAELFLPFDASVLGSGWHGPETDPKGRAFRWSSRARDVSVVLPAFGPGRHEISMEWEVLLPEQMREVHARIDEHPVEARLEKGEDGKRGTLRVENKVESGRSTAFQILELSIAGPVRPSDYGLSDQRVLGFKTHGFSLSYDGAVD